MVRDGQRHPAPVPWEPKLGPWVGLGSLRHRRSKRGTSLQISGPTVWAATCQQRKPTGFIRRDTRYSTRKEGLSKSIPRKITLGRNSISLSSNALERHHLQSA